MAGLALVAALAAQAAAQTGSPPVEAPPGNPSTAASVSAVPLGSTTYVDLEAGAGYSSNPLLSFGGSKGSAFGRLSAHAVHTTITERTTTVLSAFAQSVFYTHGLGSAQSFDISARHDASVSERLRLFVDGNASYDRGGQLDTRIIGVPNVPLLPGTTIPPVLLSPGGDFLSVTGKTYRANADAGGQLSLGAHDFVDFSTGIEHDVLKTGVFETRLTTIPVSLGYDRKLNERATVGARVVAQFTHYSGDILNGARNFRVITPELTGQLRLSEQLTFSGDIGASFTSVDNGVLTRHSAGLAADAALCSSSERSQFCGRASIQQQAATSAGPARVMSIGVDYSRRLSADDTLEFSLSANRYSNPVILVAVATFSHATYIRAAADYSRRIGGRLYGGANVAIRKLSQTGPAPNADLSAAVFIRYRLGDVR